MNEEMALWVEPQVEGWLQKHGSVYVYIPVPRVHKYDLMWKKKYLCRSPKREVLLSVVL